MPFSRFISSPWKSSPLELKPSHQGSCRHSTLSTSTSRDTDVKYTPSGAPVMSEW